MSDRYSNHRRRDLSRTRVLLNPYLHLVYCYHIFLCSAMTNYYVYYPLFCLTWVNYTYSRSGVFIGNRLDGVNNTHLREHPREPESEGVPLPPPPHQTPNISDDGKRLTGSRRRRRRRYAYEDHHEWPDNDYTEYDFDDELSDGESEGR